MKPTYTYFATVLHIVDADTFDVLIDYGDYLTQRRRLRLNHVDAYEKATEKGKQGKAFVERFLPLGAEIVVTTSKPDKYGRQLAVVQTPLGLDLASELLRAGLAVPYEGGTKTI